MLPGPFFTQSVTANTQKYPNNSKKPMLIIKPVSIFFSPLHILLILYYHIGSMLSSENESFFTTFSEKIV